MLGGIPLGTMQDYLNTTCIKEAKNEKIKECQIYENIIKDYETLNKKVIEIQEKSDNIKQYATSSLMDSYISPGSYLCFQHIAYLDQWVCMPGFLERHLGLRVLDFLYDVAS